MGITRITTVLGAGLVALAVGIGLAVADDSDARSELRVDPAATAKVFAEVAGALENVDGWRPETLAGALPNQSLEHLDGTRPASLAVVTGRVTAAEPGAAFVQPDEPDGVSPVEVPFGSAEKHIEVYRVRMDVTDAVGLEDDSIEFGLRFFGSPGMAPTEDILAGLRGLEEIVVVLSSRGRWDFDDDLYDVTLMGGLLGVVGAGGSVELPAMTGDGPDFLAGLDTVDEILAEARRPDKPPVPMLR